ncbi:MAG: type II secretion system protein [Cyanobacteria bacterium SIG32]|nr:type II secretion system protein [Cyanobacteria bacterium SIG32]
MGEGKGEGAAFTLAEVLITLAIIGVVAAMTIPTLIADYQEKQTVTKVKKLYSTLTNAHKLVEAMNGYGAISAIFDDSKTGAENTQAVVNLFKPYFKISKDCGFETGCLTSGNLKSLSGGTSIDYDNRTNEYKMLLNDGTAIWFYVAHITEDDYGNPLDQIVINVKADINGFAGPYTWGKDVFLFDINDQGVIPDGNSKNNTLYTFENNCLTANTESPSSLDGLGCTAWVIQNGNMDYLHCDDLSWTGKHKCSD